MSIFTRIAGWLKKKPLDQRLAVEFDDVEVRVVVLENFPADWNQAFHWADVKRVCFMDGGLYSSDVLLFHLGGGKKTAAVMTEARGVNELFGELEKRGLFPEQAWRRALAETGGRMHCWPPETT